MTLRKQPQAETHTACATVALTHYCISDIMQFVQSLCFIYLNPVQPSDQMDNKRSHCHLYGAGLQVSHPHTFQICPNSARCWPQPVYFKQFAQTTKRANGPQIQPASIQKFGNAEHETNASLKAYAKGPTHHNLVTFRIDLASVKPKIQIQTWHNSKRRACASRRRHVCPTRPSPSYPPLEETSARHTKNRRIKAKKQSAQNWNVV